MRWTAAVLVFAAFGAAAAYGVTQPDRTRIPGLRTQDDGRWRYPPIALPKLPPGKPRPFADANRGQHHYADIRSLLLTPPETAVTDRSAVGSTQWLPATGFLKVYDDLDDHETRAEADLLREDGLRHIAARSWTMPDGTRTDVYLLQFTTSGFAYVYSPNTVLHGVTNVSVTAKDRTVDSPMLPDVVIEAAAERPPYGATATRYAWAYAGDVIALVMQTRKGSVAEVPFRQTVRLQVQLLG
jgi:hypothetical protein